MYFIYYIAISLAVLPVWCVMERSDTVVWGRIPVGGSDSYYSDTNTGGRLPAGGGNTFYSDTTSGRLPAGGSHRNMKSSSTVLRNAKGYSNEYRREKLPSHHNSVHDTSAKLPEYRNTNSDLLAPNSKCAFAAK